jgi:hypothetical protein
MGSKRSPGYLERQAARTAAWRAQHPELDRERKLRSYRNHPDRYLWRSAKNRAQMKGIEFTITPDDVQVPTHCPVLLKPLGPVAGGQDRRYSPSLDRIDPSKGYVPGNVRVISGLANTMKSCATEEELKLFAEFIRRELH